MSDLDYGGQKALNVLIKVSYRNWLTIQTMKRNTTLRQMVEEWIESEMVKEKALQETIIEV